MGDVDPLAVPLPHGTEVTTRVDRTLGERLVPQGALGRVVGSGRGVWGHSSAEPSGAPNVEREFFDVLVVGVGTVRYSREELVPRKVGQVRYALYDLLERLRADPGSLMPETFRATAEDWFERHHVNVAILSLLTADTRRGALS